MANSPLKVHLEENNIIAYKLMRDWLDQPIFFGFWMGSWACMNKLLV